MTDATADTQKAPDKSGKMKLVIALVLALAGAGAGYFAQIQGYLPFGQSDHSGESDHGISAGDQNHGSLDGQAESSAGMHNFGKVSVDDIDFVEIDPLMISFGGGTSARHLRFRAHLEVSSADRRDVEKIRPRIVDVLNGYLRALELEDLHGQQALTRLRAQMLRRVQVVAGKDRVRDLLIMEFVLN